MAAFLKSKKKIISVTIHPAAQDILSLIGDLKLTIPTACFGKNSQSFRFYPIAS